MKKENKENKEFVLGT